MCASLTIVENSRPRYKIQDATLKGNSGMELLHYVIPRVSCRWFQVGNPLRDAGVGLNGVVSVLEALVRGFIKACSRNGPPDSGELEMIDAWSRCGTRSYDYSSVQQET